MGARHALLNALLALMRQNQVGGASSKSDSFSPQDLRDLFSVHTTTPCHTHDLIDCPCDAENSSPDSDEDMDEGVDGSDDEEERGFVVASTLNPSKMSKPVSDPPSLHSPCATYHNSRR